MKKKASNRAIYKQWYIRSWNENNFYDFD